MIWRKVRDWVVGKDAMRESCDNCSLNYAVEALITAETIDGLIFAILSVSNDPCFAS